MAFVSVKSTDISALPSSQPPSAGKSFTGPETVTGASLLAAAAPGENALRTVARRSPSGITLHKLPRMQYLNPWHIESPRSLRRRRFRGRPAAALRTAHLA